MARPLRPVTRTRWVSPVPGLGSHHSWPFLTDLTSIRHFGQIDENALGVAPSIRLLTVTISRHVLGLWAPGRRPSGAYAILMRIPPAWLRATSHTTGRFIRTAARRLPG